MVRLYSIRIVLIVVFVWTALETSILSFSFLCLVLAARAIFQ